MNKNDYVKGYKVFDPDWTCRGFRYEVGKTFEEDVMPKCCEAGFHFCKELKDCFNYYPFNPDNKVAKVIALGEIDEASNNSKCCTNKIQIVEEISWEDVLRNLNSTVILLISVPIHYYFSLSFSTLFCRPLTFSQKFLIFLLILFHLFLHFLHSFNCRPPHIFTLSEVDNFFTAKIQFYPPPYQEILCLTIFPDGF